MEKEFPDQGGFLNKKSSHPNEYLYSIDDYKKPVVNLKKQEFFSELKNKYPDDEEIERTREINIIFDFKNGEKKTTIFEK